MIINFHDDQEPSCDFEEMVAEESPRNTKFLIFFAIAISGLILKTTLASNISLGSSTSEFGQAVQVLTSCSGSTPITITPKNKFNNDSGSQGQFKLTGYEVSNIPTSCSGYQFQLNAFDSSTSTQMPLFNSSENSSVILNKNGNYFVDSSVQGETITSLSTSSYLVDFASPSAISTNIYRFTLQSQNNSLNGPFAYFDNTKLTSGGPTNPSPGSSAKSGIGGYSLATAFTSTSGSSISSVELMVGAAYSSQGANNPTAYIYSGASAPTTLLGTLTFSSINGNFVTFSTNSPITVPSKFWLLISTPSGNSSFSINYWSSDGPNWNVPVVTTWRQLSGIWVSQNSSITTLFTTYSSQWAIVRLKGN